MMRLDHALPAGFVQYSAHHVVSTPADGSRKIGSHFGGGGRYSTYDLRIMGDRRTFLEGFALAPGLRIMRYDQR